MLVKFLLLLMRKRPTGVKWNLRIRFIPILTIEGCGPRPVLLCKHFLVFLLLLPLTKMC